MALPRVMVALASGARLEREGAAARRVERRVEVRRSAADMISVSFLERFRAITTDVDIDGRLTLELQINLASGRVGPTNVILM